LGLVYNRTTSGLVLAEHSQDEAAVARLLKQHDPDLRLVPQRSDAFGRTYYSVYRYAGSERPAEFIFAWVDDVGAPLPLTSRILDRVQELDRNSRGEYLNEDERDAQVRAERDKNTARNLEDLRDDWMTREGVSAVLPRSQSLRQARSRTGYHG
jgi:hypothetical protein